jgi:hypothetical protein
MRAASIGVLLAALALGASAQSLDPLRARADRGEAEAQYALGQRYSGLSGDRLDLQQAFAYTRKAAEQGHLRAQVDLGFIYYNGNARVPKDLAASYQWFRKAADAGAVRAQCMLGDFHRQGLGGVKQDPAEAFRWYQRTATADDRCAPRSQYELYVSYASGQGVRQDERTAMQWLRKAAEAGNPVAQKRLGEHYAQGRGVPRDEELARMWRRKSREGVAPHDDHEHGHAEQATQKPGRGSDNHRH